MTSTLYEDAIKSLAPEVIAKHKRRLEKIRAKTAKYKEETRLLKSSRRQPKTLYQTVVESWAPILEFLPLIDLALQAASRETSKEQTIRRASDKRKVPHISSTIFVALG
jgi:hypothetical protein